MGVVGVATRVSLFRAGWTPSSPTSLNVKRYIDNMLWIDTPDHVSVSRSHLEAIHDDGVSGTDIAEFSAGVYVKVHMLRTNFNHARPERYYDGRIQTGDGRVGDSRGPSSRRATISGPQEERRLSQKEDAALLTRSVSGLHVKGVSSFRWVVPVGRTISDLQVDRTDHPRSLSIGRSGFSVGMCREPVVHPTGRRLKTGGLASV